MTEPSSANDDPAVPTDAADGSVDYTQYSLAQLHAHRERLDAARYPQNAQNLRNEITAREARSLQKVTTNYVCEGRFTRRGGWFGWLAAKLRRRLVYGDGAIEVRPATVALLGWQRTWLGVAQRSELTIPTSRIGNVVRDEAFIRFDVGLRRIEFVANSPESAARLGELLPRSGDPGFEQRWNEVRDFQRRLRESGARVWITPLLVIANLAVFVSMAVSTREVFGFDLPTLWAWGANYGPLTIGGQWWRLVSSLFVHLSAIHLLINLWVLWNIGRRTEQLFGNAAATALYFGTGIIASLMSIVWAPTLSSVGASGAIFGLIGAYIAFLLHPGCGVPRSIARRHWVSTAIFALFNLYAGATQPNIDNAAHIGGLISGFALGWCLARPLGSEWRGRFSYRKITVATSLFAVAVISACWWIHGNSTVLPPPARYLRAHSWYVRGESRNLSEWQTLAAASGAGEISDAELGQAFQRDILPFWKTADARITRENRTLGGDERPFALLVGQFVRLRLEWAQAVIEGTLGGDPSAARAAQKLMTETMRAAARTDLMAMRAAMAQRARPLSQAAPFIALRSLFDLAGPRCVVSPPGYQSDFDPKDGVADGPAVRHAIGCRAQRLFLIGDYRGLEALMRRYAAPRDRLPDGSSRLSGIAAGMDTLFSLGGLSLQEVLQRTADWRRAVPGSINADLAEVMALESWAWAARGHGYADMVTPQRMGIFSLRVDIAAADLEDLAKRAQSDPVWYQLSLENDLDDSEPADRLRAVFDRGRKQFPTYWPMYQAMLRALMPRWGGSYGQVDGFILAMSHGDGHWFDAARYARLYTMYSDLEGQDFDPFTAVPADWQTLKTGYDELLARYPHSDYLLNRFANFACRAKDGNTYRRLRPMIATRVLSDVWAMTDTLRKCDAGSKTWPARSPAEAAAHDRYSQWLAMTAQHSLGPITIGMTAQQLLGAAGEPVTKDQKSWTYNSIDASHNGALSAYFTPAPAGQMRRVYAIEYVGDRVSAPHEIAYIDGLSQAQLLHLFHGTYTVKSVNHDLSYIYFANGLFAGLNHGVVQSYGIYFANPP
ncbi:MAG TPA: rhomboid family intramembrane serine protease [Candidatus Binataceae bacterium]|nr:rhomboid family intramembrane serine protease [Candidatus Binataceae bacterium]